MYHLKYMRIIARNLGVGETADMDELNETLVLIRKILRATELHGKELRAATGLKTSELLVLQVLDDLSDYTVGQIATQIYMAQTSVTMIVNRLQDRGLVAKSRGEHDKRKVYVSLTDDGRQVLGKAPEALHQRFAEQFDPLEHWEKTMLIASLQRVAAMLNASDIDAAPLLQLDPPEQVDITLHDDL